jgi:hypothetical protein
MSSLHVLSLPQCEQLSSLEGIEEALSLHLFSISAGSLSSLQVLFLHNCWQLSSLGGRLSRSRRCKSCSLFRVPASQSLAPLSGLSSLQGLSLYSCKQLQSLAGIKQSLSLCAAREVDRYTWPVSFRGLPKEVLTRFSGICVS